MSEYKLTQQIIARSFSTIWDKAKIEWTLFEIYESEELDTCLCGKAENSEVAGVKNLLAMS